MKPTLASLRRELRGFADADIAQHSQRFFHAAPGEYGAGDRFRGIRVPRLRQLARRYRALPLRDVEALLGARYHEDRLTALFILCLQFARADGDLRAAIYRLYLANTGHVNNWDLVDASAEHIVGAWLAGKDKAPLRRLARSQAWWERRIAMLATFHDIKRGEFTGALTIARMLLRDPHDLIHKAAGWMLREVGKRDRAHLLAFLTRHHRDMPRTMLRYATEKLPAARRQAFLRGDGGAANGPADAAARR